MENQETEGLKTKNRIPSKLIILSIFIVLALSIIILIFNNHSLQNKIFEIAVNQRVNLPRNDLGGEKNLDILFCGSGSPFPDMTNKRGQPCLAVFAKNHFFIFDSGSGSADKLGLYRAPLGRLSHVFLTHLHSDHMAGLGDLRLMSWVQGQSSSLKVFGPQGTKRTVEGFREAYFIDSTFRVAHHGVEILKPQGSTFQTEEIIVKKGEKGRVVFQDGSLKITAYLVDHSPIEPAFGYRVDFGDRSLTLSGDSVKHPNIAQFSRGSDVLIHEALHPMMVKSLSKRFQKLKQKRMSKIMDDILDYHTTPLEAAKTANEAEAKLLVLSHIVPPLLNPFLERIFLREALEIRGKGTILAFDGLHLRLPLGQKTILHGDLRP